MHAEGVTKHLSNADIPNPCALDIEFDELLLLAKNALHSPTLLVVYSSRPFTSACFKRGMWFEDH